MIDALTFLIVDGDPPSRFLVCAELQSAFEGSHLIEAGTVAEAIAKAKAVRPDAVITEHNLVPIDGTALVTSLRDMGYREPILLLTGSRDPAIQRRAQEAGADGTFYNWESDYVSFLQRRLGAAPEASLRNSNDG
jgi:DNA-binding response OmpR family regulator